MPTPAVLCPKSGMTDSALAPSCAIPLGANWGKQIHFLLGRVSVQTTERYPGNNRGSVEP
jgi:hypothetical protein